MKERFPNCCLGVFAKHWTPGQVKTRLAASIGEAEAAEIYRHFVETTLTRLNRLPINRRLAVSPPNQREAFASIATGWNISNQGEGDLGERMLRFFAERFQEGHERVVLLGTDCPHVPLEYIEGAFELLAEHDAVFGPTEDGGYYLVGLSRRADHLFEDIPWSTPKVWPTTQVRLQEAELSSTTVSTWYDVDTMADLDRLLVDLGDETSSDLKDLAKRLAHVL